MGLKIKILCSSPNHPVVPWIMRWMEDRSNHDAVSLVHSTTELGSGDILFLISVSEMIGPDIRTRFQHTAVVHASDLPEGRGWSPHVWAILSGKNSIVVTALEAAAQVDSGAIWAKTRIEIPKTALFDEINERLFNATLQLMTKVCDMIESGDKPQPQDGGTPSYWPRRTPVDSEIDPNESITSQFDAIRVCDPNRYPAFFRLHGEVFEISLKKRYEPS
ncbi:formyltransferase family protein [Sulfitobacter faviae]|uniref:formyltransferase family protein n=1 Tax=Sulfitobacter faviae TaxID=1775881 RepID=UPI00398CC946